jgi:hypothetical protein
MAQSDRHKWRWPVLAATIAFIVSADAAGAETRVVRIATQYGISYLPLTIIASTLAVVGGRLAF